MKEHTNWLVVFKMQTDPRSDMTRIRAEAHYNTEEHVSKRIAGLTRVGSLDSESFQIFEYLKHSFAWEDEGIFARFVIDGKITPKCKLSDMIYLS